MSVVCTWPRAHVNVHDNLQAQGAIARTLSNDMEPSEFGFGAEDSPAPQTPSMEEPSVQSVSSFSPRFAGTDPLDYAVSSATVAAKVAEYTKKPNKNPLGAVPTELLAADSSIEL